MRPRGEVRAALSGAAEQWAIEQAKANVEPDKLRGITWRQLAELACVGYAAAHHTVKTMVKARELVPKEPVRVPGSRRPMTAYLPAHMLMPSEQNGLDAVMRGWGHS